MYRIGHILLATDGSEGSRAAADLAGLLALNCNSRVSIVIVHSVAASAIQAFTGALPDSVLPGVSPKRDAKKQIEAATDEHVFPAAESALGVVPGGSKRVQLWGHAAEAICSYAAENNVDMIVIGSRGRGTFKSLLIGGTGSQILAHAHCPVAVAR